MVRTQLRAERIEKLEQARQTLAANPLPPMTPEEIQAEIDVGPLEQALRRLEQPAFLVYPRLLARYGQMDVPERLRDASDREAGSPGFIVLAPADQETRMPVVDGVPVLWFSALGGRS